MCGFTGVRYVRTHALTHVRTSVRTDVRTYVRTDGRTEVGNQSSVGGNQSTHRIMRKYVTLNRLWCCHLTNDICLPDEMSFSAAI